MSILSKNTKELISVMLPYIAVAIIIAFSGLLFFFGHSLAFNYAENIVDNVPLAEIVKDGGVVLMQLSLLQFIAGIYIGVTKI